MTNLSDLSPADANKVLRWVDICRAMRMTGQMRDFSKAECLRVAGLIQRQVEAGNVERVQRGHYRLIAVDQDQETDEPAAA